MAVLVVVMVVVRVVVQVVVRVAVLVVVRVAVTVTIHPMLRHASVDYRSYFPQLRVYGSHYDLGFRYTHSFRI